MTDIDDIHYLIDHVDRDAESNEFYLYDFDQLKYRACQKVDYLPYDLIKIQFIDDATNAITCCDSYRLAQDQNDFLEVDELNEQYQWRKQIVLKGVELDFDYNNDWIKVEVLCIKSDVVSGILLLAHRKTRYALGYYYYESSRLAKSSTYTHKMTDAEIKEEEEMEKIAAENYQKSTIRENEIVDQTPIYKFGKNLDKCYDFQIFAQHLKLRSASNVESYYYTEIEHRVKEECKENITPHQKCLYTLLRDYDKEYGCDGYFDGAKIYYEANEYFCKKFNMYSDIKIMDLDHDCYEVTLCVNDIVIDIAEFDQIEMCYYFPLLKDKFLPRIYYGPDYCIRFKKDSQSVEKPVNAKIIVCGILLNDVMRRVGLTISAPYITIDDPRNKLFIFIGCIFYPTFTMTYHKLKYDPVNPYMNYKQILI